MFPQRTQRSFPTGNLARPGPQVALPTLATRWRCVPGRGASARLAGVNQQQVSYPAHQFHGPGNHSQVERRGNEGRPGRTGGKRGAGFSRPRGETPGSGL